ADDFRNRIQAELPGNSIGEFHRPLPVKSAKRRTHCLAADPKAAAFVSEVRSPSTDAKHISIDVAADDDGSCAGNQQNTGIDTDRAYGCDERITLDDDPSAGNKRLKNTFIKRRAVGTRRAGESGTDNVRGLGQAGGILC